MAMTLRYPEKILVHLAPGTIQRLKAVAEGRQIGPLVRDLIERELKTRERAGRKVGGDKADLRISAL